MAKKQTEQQQNNVVSLVTNRCIAEGCSKKADRMNFCPEHYDWFKFGLITKTGERPTDFDRKYQAYQKHKKAA